MADGSLPTHRYDVRQLAAALGVTKRALELRAQRERWPFAEEPVRGGRRRLYPLESLPADVTAAIVLASRKIETPTPAAARAANSSDARIQSAWDRYARVPQSLKDVALRRVQALHAVNRLVQSGRGVVEARAAVAAQLQREGVRGGSPASLARWAAEVDGAEPQHWVALLVPAYAGRTTTAQIPPEAWDLFRADFLRPERPSATSCYDRLQRIAAQRGWALPCLRTFERRLEREVPYEARVLARHGEEALDKLLPPQERDRSVFHALEAVNADGHRFDVFVRFPSGRIARPVMVAVQDIYSGKLLGWRIGETESSDLARLAFRDVVERYGIPHHAWLDNGRGFASKLLTGGVANRYRFKVREEDPTGILVALGVQIHWATPYHGQAKPIERAFRDLCDRVAKHPAFAGAYTGHRVDAKPENYGSRAVDFDDFLRVVQEEIAAHNAKEGRRSKVANGRSFDVVFGESYARAPIRRATDEQLRQMLLAAEVATTSSLDGSVHLLGNRYWCEALPRHAGKRVLLRFDPDALHTAVHVYTLGNAFIGTAECIASVGFADTQAGREHARWRKQHRRAARQALEAERRMDAARVAAQLPAPAPESLPPPGVVAPLFGKPRTPPAPEPDTAARTGTDDARSAALADFLARQAEAIKNRLT